MSIPTIVLLRGGHEVVRLDGLIREQDLEEAVRVAAAEVLSNRRRRKTILYRTRSSSRAQPVRPHSAAGTPPLTAEGNSRLAAGRFSGVS